MIQESNKLFGNSFIEFYNLENSILYANWCGYVNVNQVKEGCELMLELVKKHEFRFLLNDNRLVLGSFTQAIGWLGQNFMSRIVSAGIIKIAFVYSKVEAAKYSINRLLEVNTDYEGQAFEKYPDALNWLRGASNIGFDNIFLTLPSKLIQKTKIVYNDILYITSIGNLIMINTKDQKYKSVLSLKKILSLLPHPQFSRVHKSYIVNIHFINKIKYHAGGTYRLNLTGLGKVFIPVGRVYAPELKERLKNIM